MVLADGGVAEDGGRGIGRDSDHFGENRRTARWQRNGQRVGSRLRDRNGRRVLSRAPRVAPHAVDHRQCGALTVADGGIPCYAQVFQRGNGYGS